MRVVLTMDRAGPAGTFYAGEVLDLPAAEALRLLAASQAVEEGPERADDPPPRNAARPRPQTRSK